MCGVRVRVRVTIKAMSGMCGESQGNAGRGRNVQKQILSSISTAE